MRERLPILLFALVMAAIPFIPGMPPFWIVLLDNIGLSALVAMGLVLLTGVGGLTSFGQAAFCGFGAYTTAVLTTAYGLSPWLTLPLSLLVSGLAAVLLGLVTVRLSGHYLPLGTIAWGIGLFYLFSKLEFLGRNDGISGDSAAVDRLVQDDRSRHDLLRDLDRGAAVGAAHDEPPGLPHRPRHPRAAARPCRRRSVWRADAARQAAGVHLCRGAGRPLRLALRAFPARRQSDPVRRAGRHRISVHRGGRRRRLCLGRRAGRGHRRHPQGNPAKLPALSLRRSGPARDHRVRHHAGGAAATGADRGLAMADGATRAQARRQAARSDAGLGGAPARSRRLLRAAADRECAQAIRRRHRRQQRLVRRPGARDRRADRAERRRQEHDLQSDHRRALQDRRQDFRARQERRQRAAAGSGKTRRRPHVPARQAGARHDGAGKRRDRRASARPCRRAVQHAPARSRRRGQTVGGGRAPDRAGRARRPDRCARRPALARPAAHRRDRARAVRRPDAAAAR